MRMVRVSTSRPRARSLLCGLQQGFGRGQSGSLLVRQLRDEAANPGGMQRDGDAVGRDVDPLDQQPQDACLLGRVELVPDRLQRSEGFDDIALLELRVLCCAVLWRTAVMVRATSSGDASSRRTCPRTSSSTSLAKIERTGQVSWPLRPAPRQTYSGTAGRAGACGSASSPSGSAYSASDPERRRCSGAPRCSAPGVRGRTS